MKNVLKRNDGSALAMIIIVSTISIMLLTTLLNLAFHNLKLARTLNKASNAYYIVDLGMEKTLKEVETMVESAKNYAITNVKTSLKSYTIPSVETMTPYNHFTKYGDIDTFLLDYEGYYKTYLSDAKFQLASTAGVFNSLVGYSELPGAQFKSAINSATFNSDYKIVISVDGNDDGKFPRKIDAEIGLSPWGYDSGGNVIVPDEDDIVINEDVVYESQQWANALSSSGDIIVRAGATGIVTVNGDTYVNGKVTTATGDEVFDGMNFGGLVIGKSGIEGHMVVNGNIITNNYVHTLEANSTLTVNTTSESNIEQIYTDYENSPYLNNNSSDPLNFGSSLIGPGSLGKKQAYSGIDFIKFINYIKDTYKIQKQNGGFVYADCIQVEKPALNSNININGSAIVFNNLSVNGDGDIKIKKNFYGFKYEGLTYNDSSSIIINHQDGLIDLSGRVYNGSTAYVTTFFTDIDGSLVPYVTAESISLFKNYYGYRYPISPDDDAVPIKIYSPFNMLDLSPTDKIRHVFSYDGNITGDTISNGGIAYDKTMVKLSALYNDTVGKPLYDNGKLNNTHYDMGYTQGVLMGKNAIDDDFIGVIKPYLTAPPIVKISKGSLTDEAFANYISDKYNTLMEIKALKLNSGKTITIDQLVDNSATGPINGWSNKIYPSSPNANMNYFITDGDISIATSSGRITANGQVISNSLTYNGLILATGRITINTSSNIIINGAIISTNSTDNVGIEFMGAGTKTINYDKNLLTSIFKLPTDDAKSIKEYLTSKRGIVEMFKEAYTNGLVPGFIEGVDEYISDNPSVSTPEEAIEELVKLYYISNSDYDTNEIVVLSSGIINNSVSAGGNNYKVLKWSTSD